MVYPQKIADITQTHTNTNTIRYQKNVESLFAVPQVQGFSHSHVSSSSRIEKPASLRTLLAWLRTAMAGQGGPQGVAVRCLDALEETWHHSCNKGRILSPSTIFCTETVTWYLLNFEDSPPNPDPFCRSLSEARWDPGWVKFLKVSWIRPGIRTIFVFYASWLEVDPKSGGWTFLISQKDRYVQ